MNGARVLVAAVVAAGIVEASAGAAPAAPDAAWGAVGSLATAGGRIYAITRPAGGGSVVRLLDASLHDLAHVATPAGVDAYALAVSPDHRALAVARTDGAIWILDAATLKERRIVRVRGRIEKLPDATNESEDPFGEIRGVGYTPAGKLVSISERGALCFEDKATCYDAMPSHTGVIPAGRIASFGVARGRAVFAWRASKLVSLQPGTEPIRLGHDHDLPDNRAEALAAAPTGWVAIAYMRDSFDLLDAGHQLHIKQPGVTVLAFSPAGRYLAVGTSAGPVRYDLRCIAATPPAATALSSAGSPATVALVVTDRGEVISADATGQITTSEADDRAAVDAPC